MGMRMHLSFCDGTEAVKSRGLISLASIGDLTPSPLWAVFFRLGPFGPLAINNGESVIPQYEAAFNKKARTFSFVAPLALYRLSPSFVSSCPIDIVARSDSDILG